MIKLLVRYPAVGLVLTVMYGGIVLYITITLYKSNGFIVTGLFLALMYLITRRFTQALKVKAKARQLDWNQ